MYNIIIICFLFLITICNTTMLVLVWKIRNENEFKRVIGYKEKEPIKQEPKKRDMTRSEIIKDLAYKNANFQSSDSDEQLRNEYNRINKGKYFCTKVLKEEPDSLGILHIV